MTSPALEKLLLGLSGSRGDVPLSVRDHGHDILPSSQSSRKRRRRNTIRCPPDRGLLPSRELSLMTSSSRTPEPLWSTRRTGRGEWPPDLVVPSAPAARQTANPSSRLVSRTRRSLARLSSTPIKSSWTSIGLEEPAPRPRWSSLLGNGALDRSGRIDGAKIAEAVFADPAKRHALETRIHSLGRAEIERRFTEGKSGRQRRRRGGLADPRGEDGPVPARAGVLPHPRISEISSSRGVRPSDEKHLSLCTRARRGRGGVGGRAGERDSRTTETMRYAFETLGAEDFRELQFYGEGPYRRSLLRPPVRNCIRGRMAGNEAGHPQGEVARQCQGKQTHRDSDPLRRSMSTWHPAIPESARPGPPDRRFQRETRNLRRPTRRARPRLGFRFLASLPRPPPTTPPLRPANAALLGRFGAQLTGPVCVQGCRSGPSPPRRKRKCSTFPRRGLVEQGGDRLYNALQRLKQDGLVRQNRRFDL